MKLPRDLSGADLIKKLETLGYRKTRQTGSHIRLTCDKPRQHHLTVPAHDPLRIGTLAAIVTDVATYQNLKRDELIEKLFPKR